MQRKKLFSESFLWKRESSFDKEAEIFLRKPRETFGQCPKKIGRITFEKNCTKSFSLDLQISFLITEPNLFRQSSEKKSVFCPKKLEKSIFWKTFFSLKCSYGHVECSFNKPAKNRQEAENICSVSENDKKFHLFSKTVFFSKNVSIDT